MFDSRSVASGVGLLALLTLIQPVRGQQPSSLPATGKAAAVLKPVDTAVATVMARHGIPGAALSIAKDGKLVFARGYGWANLATEELVQPDTLFGLASLSKTFTAVAILKLVEQGRLSLEDHPFKILDQIEPPAGAKVDSRLYEITVRHLLNHSGGWDHQASGDPVNWTTKMHLKLGARTPIAAGQLIAFTMSVPLDFDPGTDAKYSNFGYIVLGEVIAKVSGQSYERFVQDHVLAPVGIHRAILHPLGGRYLPNEAHRYLAGTDNELPAWQQKYSDATGGWTASALDLIRFLTALDGSRGKPLLNENTFKMMIEPPRSRDHGTYFGLGWDSVIQTETGYAYFKDGNWFGMRCFMKRLPNGVNWVLLFNASMQPDVFDTKVVGDAVKEVRQTLEGLEKYPDIDLFEEFR